MFDACTKLARSDSILKAGQLLQEGTDIVGKTKSTSVGRFN